MLSYSLKIVLTGSSDGETEIRELCYEYRLNNISFFNHLFDWLGLERRIFKIYLKL